MSVTLPLLVKELPVNEVMAPAKVPALVTVPPTTAVTLKVSVRPAPMLSRPACELAAPKVHVPAFTLTLPPLLLVKVVEVLKFPLLVWFTAPLFTTGTFNCPKLSKLMLNTPLVAFCTLPLPFNCPAPQLMVPLLVKVLLRVLMLPVVRVVVAPASIVKPAGPAIVPPFHVSVPPGAMVVPLPAVVFQIAPDSSSRTLVVLVNGVFCVTVLLTLKCPHR